MPTTLVEVPEVLNKDNIDKNDIRITLKVTDYFVVEKRDKKSQEQEVDLEEEITKTEEETGTVEIKVKLSTDCILDDTEVGLEEKPNQLDVQGTQAPEVERDKPGITGGEETIREVKEKEKSTRYFVHNLDKREEDTDSTKENKEKLAAEEGTEDGEVQDKTAEVQVKERVIDKKKAGFRWENWGLSKKDENPSSPNLAKVLKKKRRNKKNDSIKKSTKNLSVK